MSEISKLSLIEMQPYIMGEATLEPGKSRFYRLSKSILEDFVTYLEQDSVAKEVFALTENPKDFYKVLPDVAHLIPKEYRTEVFFAAKLDNTFYDNVSTEVCYYVKLAVDKCYGIYNLIPKLLPYPVLQLAFNKGVLISASLFDIINTFCNGNYNPFTATKYRVLQKDFDEVYVASVDMVAALPKPLSSCIDDNQIRNIVATPTGLAIGSQLLRTLGNYVGVVDSIYDLRKLL